jgi:hypothetical protein
VFGVDPSVVDDCDPAGLGANVVVGEPSSDIFSISKSSSLIAVTVKSVPDPASGG